MRLNQNIQVIGNKVVLVPYEAKHVEKYHGWMQSPELQELTASEPLTLEEEYAMQRSWREDDDKCTFLILDRETYDETSDEILSLIGDTNLFLRTDNDDNTAETHLVAEAEIMIAESNARGKGFGWEAMLLMFRYAVENLNINRFEAKIGMENEKSLRMFTKMHFAETSRSDVFREITLQRKVDTGWLQWLNGQILLKLERYHQ